jgi:nucleoside-diphosphate-sugar epimerase
VTGSTGFVGTALCRELAHRNLPFRPVTRTARPGAVTIADIAPETDWSAALAGIDTVVHLAARVHVMHDKETDPLAAFRRTNVEGTLALARQFAAAGGKRFVFVSSIKVNGEGTHGTAYKASDVPAPMDPYGRSKAEAERALFVLARETGMEVVVIRPPLVYGPGVKANFAAMIKWVRRGIPLPLASVSNSRSLIYVENLVDLILAAAAHPAAPGRVFLASDDCDVSTPELLAVMGKAAGRPARVFAFPPALLRFLATVCGQRAVATRLLGSLQVDVSDTRSILEWSPPIPFDRAIQQTLDGAP